MAAAAARRDDPLFNRATLGQVYLLFATELAFVFIIRFYGRALAGAIDVVLAANKGVDVDGYRQAKNEELRKKIAGFRAGSEALVWGQLPNVIAGAVFMGIGSVPFLWILNFLLFSTATPSIVLTTLRIFRNNPNQTSPANTDDPGSSNNPFKSSLHGSMTTTIATKPV